MPSWLCPPYFPFCFFCVSTASYALFRFQRNSFFWMRTICTFFFFRTSRSKQASKNRNTSISGFCYVLCGFLTGALFVHPKDEWTTPFFLSFFFFFVFFLFFFSPFFRVAHNSILPLGLFFERRRKGIVFIVARCGVSEFRMWSALSFNSLLLRVVRLFFFFFSLSPSARGQESAKRSGAPGNTITISFTSFNKARHVCRLHLYYFFHPSFYYYSVLLFAQHDCFKNTASLPFFFFSAINLSFCLLF